MTKEEIEQGAKAYLLGDEMELVRNAFEAGAEWALSHQWHKIARSNGKISVKGD